MVTACKINYLMLWLVLLILIGGFRVRTLCSVCSRIVYSEANLSVGVEQEVHASVRHLGTSQEVQRVRSCAIDGCLETDVDLEM